MRKLLAQLWRDENGTVAIEYVIVAGLVSVMIIAAATSVGTKTSTHLQQLADNM